MAETQKRNVHIFAVPPSIVASTGVHEVCLVTLTAQEELDCFKRGQANNAKLASELAKACFVEADGVKLSLADGSVDTYWSNMEPQLRQLVLTAYGEIHAVKDEDAAVFLKSRKLRVG